MKIVKIATWIIIGLIVVATCRADSVIIPFSCYPKVLQAKFKEHGFILDLKDDDRTESSWAFLENKGSSFTIHTYKPVSPYELKLIQKLAMEK